jgi:hypothetical protein
METDEIIFRTMVFPGVKCATPLKNVADRSCPSRPALETRKHAIRAPID